MPDSALYPLVTDLLPCGSAWSPAKGEDLELYLDGKATNLEQPESFLECLGCVRSPESTPYLDDLEREYGLYPDTLATETERRADLANAKKATGGQGPDYLLQRLIDAGFTNLQIHENRPPADPNIFLNSVYLAVCGNETTVCGNENAVCGQTGGQLLANGPLFEQDVAYIACCGNENAVCGNENAVAGRFDELSFTERVYTIPTNINYWGFFFFVGGDATRDISGALTAIETVDIDNSRESELKRIILKYKPVQTWAGLQINFT